MSQVRGAKYHSKFAKRESHLSKGWVGRFKNVRTYGVSNDISVNQYQFDISVITARVRSTREGTVFSGVCLSTFRGGGYLPCRKGVPTFQGGGVPTFQGKGGTYLPSGGTYLGGRGTYLGRGYLPWRGVPTLVGGYLPWQGDLPWWGDLPWQGGYLPSQCVLAMWRAVCFLRSRRRTFLLTNNFTK